MSNSFNIQNYIQSKLIVLCLLLASSTVCFADTGNPFDQSTWLVSPNSYSYDMTITTVLRFGLEESTDPNDKIAAFCGDDCRGVEFARTIVEGRYLAYLRVYGNESSNDIITLYMYDASEDKIIEVKETLPFVPQANYGIQTNPYVATIVSDVVFTLQADGSPIAGATVEFEGFESQNSDANGMVIFADVEPNEDVTYSIAAKGYDIIEKSIEIDDQDVSITEELELTTYKVSIEVTDGVTPLQNAKVFFGDFEEKYTNVYGKVVYETLEPEMGITYEVSIDNHTTKKGTVSVVDADVITKCILQPIQYSINFSATNGSDPIKDVEIISSVNEVVVLDVDDDIIPNEFDTNEWSVSSEAILGDYCLKSNTIADNQQARIVMQRTFGAGKISFYAKVSSEEENDGLTFLIDGVEIQNWSGETDWQYAAYDLSAGDHELEWRYEKDGSTNTGEDCAWIDYIVYTSDVLTHKTTQTNAAGEATLNGFISDTKVQYTAQADHYNLYEAETVAGPNKETETIVMELETYQVVFEITDGVTPLQNAKVTFGDKGEKVTDIYGKVTYEAAAFESDIAYQVSIDNHASTEGVVSLVTDDVIVKAILKPTLYSIDYFVSDETGPLSDVEITSNVNQVVIVDVLDENMPDNFVSNGVAPWMVNNDAILGDYCLKSSPITNNQKSSITLNRSFGEGTISFYVKVSSEKTNDGLVFTIDGEEMKMWSGINDWLAVEFDLAAGDHELEWYYIKDGNTSEGEDCAWIDYIVYSSDIPTQITKTTNASGEATLSGFGQNEIVSYTVASPVHHLFESKIIAKADMEIENVVLDLKTYDVAIEVTDGVTPLEGATVILGEHGEKQTDVFGKVVFEGLVPEDDIIYEVSIANHIPQQGVLSVIDTDILTKYILTPALYTIDFTVTDEFGPVRDIDIYSFTNEVVVEDILTEEVPEDFETEGSAAWTVSEDAILGDYCLKSSRVADNQKSKMEMNLPFGDGKISFYVKVSSEKENDGLVFLIDGEEKQIWSGESDWQQAEFELSEGDHTLEWQYRKDGTTTSGEDCAWVDYIVYTSDVELRKSETTDTNGQTTLYDCEANKQIFFSTVSNYHYDYESVVSINGDSEIEIALQQRNVIDVANTITPNGDGYNDFWEIYNIDRFTEAEFKIYSKRGELIYTTNDYKNNKWDGTYNGQKLPDGIYYYIVTNSVENYQYKGIINLLN